jgi:hypothetical protein
VHVHVSGGVLADGERELRLGVPVGVALHELADEDRLAPRVRHLDAHHRLARNGREDADRRRAQRHGEVVGEVDDAAHLDTRSGLELEGGDHRAGSHRDDLAGHAEVGELVLEDAGAGEQRRLVDRLRALLRWVEQAHGRQAIGVLAE